MIVLMAVAVIELVALFWLWGEYQSLESQERANQFLVDKQGQEIEQVRQRIEDVEARYESRIESLLQQVQDYAEKLTSMTERGFTPTKEQRVPDEDPEKSRPYSQQLMGLLDRIESPQARQLVEEDVERMRANGIADEQIYEEILEGGEDRWI